MNSMDNLIQSPLSLLWHKSLLQIPLQLQQILPNFLLNMFTPLNSSVERILSPWIKSYRMTRILCVSAGPSLDPWKDLHRRISISLRKSIQFHISDSNPIVVSNWEMDSLPNDIQCCPIGMTPNSIDLYVYLHMNQIGPISEHSAEEMIRSAINAHASIVMFDVWRPNFWILTWILLPILGILISIKENWQFGLQNLVFMLLLIPLRWIGEIGYMSIIHRSLQIRESQLLSSNSLQSHCRMNQYEWSQGTSWHFIWPMRYLIVYPKSIQSAKRLND
jgi:hypothetical protein